MTRIKLFFGSFVAMAIALVTVFAIAQEPTPRERLDRRHGMGQQGPGAGGPGRPMPGSPGSPGSPGFVGSHGPGAAGGPSEITTHHAAAETEAVEPEHEGPPPLNPADIWDKKRPALLALFINFGLLVGLYYTLGKKPIAEALRQRRVTIGKDIEDAQKMLDEAKERAKKYQGDLKNVDADAAMAKAALVAAAKGEVERLLGEAEEKAERMKRDAERLVEQERKQAHEDLLHETVDLAVEHGMKILEQAVTADDHQRLAQDLLAELAARPGARSSTGSIAPPASRGGAS